MGNNYSSMQTATRSGFRKAIKSESDLLMAITGPSGSGKTFTALKLGSFIAAKAGSRVALIDTENGSSAKYADLFDFDIQKLSAPYTMEKYMDAIAEARAAGYKVLIIDSMSHAWNGSGGALEQVDLIAAASPSKNSYMAWGQVTPVHGQFLNSIIQAGMHIIATMRSKTAYVQEQRVSKNGRTYNVPVKIGMEPIQREGVAYEFDITLDMTIGNVGVIDKSRCHLLTGTTHPMPGDDLSSVIWGWLQESPEATEAKKQVAAAETARLESLRQEEVERKERWLALEEKIVDAPNVNVWATFAYQLQDVQEHFEDITKVEAFRRYIGGEIGAEPAYNAALTASLAAYVDVLGNGHSKHSATSEAVSVFLREKTAVEKEAKLELQAQANGEQVMPPAAVSPAAWKSADDLVTNINRIDQSADAA